MNCKANYIIYIFMEKSGQSQNNQEKTRTEKLRRKLTKPKRYKIKRHNRTLADMECQWTVQLHVDNEGKIVHFLVNFPDKNYDNDFNEEHQLPIKSFSNFYFKFQLKAKNCNWKFGIP